MQTNTPGISREVPQGTKPLAVSVKIACKLVGVGNTTMWALISPAASKQLASGADVS